MACQQCKSEKVANLNSKCDDRFDMQLGDLEYGPDYPPEDAGIGGSGYVEFDYCLDCGQIQGEFPVHPQCFETEEED